MSSQKVRQSVTLPRFGELQEWLAGDEKAGRAPESQRAFALRSGIEKQKLTRLLTGQMKRFDLELIAKVAKATGGEIGAEQFEAYRQRLRAAAKKSTKRRSAA